MNCPAYPSDLSDEEWELIQPLIPVHQGVGHPQTVERREILNAIFYWADNCLFNSCILLSPILLL
jgi:putative transposase